MTTHELTQSHEAFINAGRNGCLIAVHPQDNPYKASPYKELWEKGHAEIRRKYHLDHNGEPRQRRDNKRRDPKKKRPQGQGLQFPAKRNLVGRSRG